LRGGLKKAEKKNWAPKVQTKKGHKKKKREDKEEGRRPLIGGGGDKPGVVSAGVAKRGGGGTLKRGRTVTGGKGVIMKNSVLTRLG